MQHLGPRQTCTPESATWWTLALQEHCFRVILDALGKMWTSYFCKTVEDLQLSPVLPNLLSSMNKSFS